MDTDFQQELNSLIDRLVETRVQLRLTKLVTEWTGKDLVAPGVIGKRRGRPARVAPSPEPVAAAPKKRGRPPKYKGTLPGVPAAHVA